MFDHITQSAIDHELFCAENARLTGNEGKARVCARRAAGVAIRAMLMARGEPVNNPSAYAALTYLSQLNSTPEHIREITDRLMTRVSPDYTLPIKTDLISDARELIAWAAEKIPGAHT